MGPVQSTLGELGEGLESAGVSVELGKAHGSRLSLLLSYRHSF
jgi:hypothetical protein